MNLSAQFDAYLRARRDEVEAALADILPIEPVSPTVIADAMRYSLSAGGKRLRPVLCLAAADAVDGDRTLALPAACALELIHTYSLIHDDLPAMDNDSLRRGRPTLHVVVGDGMAILAGDGLLTEAFSLLARAPVSSDPVIVSRKLRVIGLIADAAGARGMVGGQAVDLSSTMPGADGRAPDALDADGMRGMHARKTGALIRASAVAGAIMGGAAEPALHAIDSAGTELGLAFQIVDDILDVEGDSAALGKTPGKDAAAGKCTYPAFYGIAESRRMAADCLARAEAALATAGLAESSVMEIGRWIVQRSH